MGQKWGIRRFQNADGSLTAAGKKRYSTGAAEGAKGNSNQSSAKESRSGLTDSQKEVLKKVGKAALIAGSVAAAGYLYKNNSEAVNAVVSEVGKKTVSSIGNLAAKGQKYTQELGKQALEGAKDGVKQVPQKVREGISEGIASGSKSVVKVAAEGAAILAARKFLESTFGPEEVDSSIQAYNAYNKKRKVGQVNTGRNEDDDDE